MKNVPEKIYLNLGFDPEPEDDYNELFEFFEPTWCEDKTHSGDIEYKLNKIVNPTKEPLPLSSWQCECGEYVRYKWFFCPYCGAKLIWGKDQDV